MAVFGGLRDRLHNHRAFVDLDLHRGLLQIRLNDPKELLCRVPGCRMVSAIEPHLLHGDQQGANGLEVEHRYACGALPAFSQCAAKARVSASGWCNTSVSVAVASGVPSVPSAAMASLRTRRSPCWSAVFAWGTRAELPISASDVTTFRATSQPGAGRCAARSAARARASAAS